MQNVRAPVANIVFHALKSSAAVLACMTVFVAQPLHFWALRSRAMCSMLPLQRPPAVAPWAVASVPLRAPGHVTLSSLCLKAGRAASLRDAGLMVGLSLLCYKCRITKSDKQARIMTNILLGQSVDVSATCEHPLISRLADWRG